MTTITTTKIEACHYEGTYNGVPFTVFRPDVTKFYLKDGWTGIIHSNNTVRVGKFEGMGSKKDTLANIKRYIDKNSK